MFGQKPCGKSLEIRQLPVAPPGFCDLTLLRQSQNSETRHDEQKRGFVGFL